MNLNEISTIEYDVSKNLTTGETVIKLNENNKSIFEIGNIKIYNTKKFNWIQKKMIKFFFGFEVKDYVKDKR